MKKIFCFIFNHLPEIYPDYSYGSPPEQAWRCKTCHQELNPNCIMDYTNWFGAMFHNLYHKVKGFIDWFDFKYRNIPF